jgi:uncharacterized protein (DUF736 family)
MIKLGAGWKKTSSNGNDFISCKLSIPFLGDIHFSLWENKEKTDENHPDYNITWSAPKKGNDNKGE